MRKPVSRSGEKSTESRLECQVYSTQAKIVDWPTHHVGRYSGHISTPLCNRQSPRLAHLHSLVIAVSLWRIGNGELTSFDCICKASLSYRNYRILSMCYLYIYIYIYYLYMCTPYLSLSLTLSFSLCLWISLSVNLSFCLAMLIALRLQHSARVWVIIPNTHTTRCTTLLPRLLFLFPQNL